MKEITDNRPSHYSKWHRNPDKLPSWCKMTDGDFFEQRVVDGRFCSVAYIETIEVDDVNTAQMGGYPIYPHKDALCKEIQEKMKIPSYIVYNNPECTDFLVFSYVERVYRRMVESEYVDFIKGLGHPARPV